MSASLPCGFSRLLPRLPRTGIAAALIGVTAACAWIGIAASRRHETAMWENYRRDQELRFSGVVANPLEQRRAELAALLVEVENGQILTKSDVVSRLGRPDTSQETGSKQYSDRTISTRYRYRLAPGEYLFPSQERADLGAGWHADFLFDERANHGRRGRLLFRCRRLNAALRGFNLRQPRGLWNLPVSFTGAHSIQSTSGRSNGRRRAKA